MHEKKIIVGMVGSLGLWVDIHMIMQVAKHFEHEKVKFHIIGSGERFTEFEQLIDKNNVSNIKLFGNISHDKMYSYMNKFDVAIIPFIRNKITDSVSPIKLFEYWLAKKPVVSTWTFELAQFSKEILMCNNYHEMILAIKDLFDFKERERIGNLGYNLVKTKYNWNNMIKKYEDVI